MKLHAIARILPFAAVVLMVVCVRADIVEMHSDFVYRIGHRVGIEIALYSTALAITGWRILRKLAKGSWQIKDTAWKIKSEVTVEDATDVVRKLDNVRPQLRAAFRKAYESEQGCLGACWKQDLILSVFEENESMLKWCHGVPMECLVDELMLEVGDELKSRLTLVLPEVQRVFDAKYDAAAAVWLQKDEDAYKRTECYKKKRELSSWIGVVKGLFIPGYRRKAKMVIASYERQVRMIPIMFRLGAPDPWLKLCNSLVENILAEDKELRMKCRGVAQGALAWAVIRSHQSDGYKMGYKGEYTVQEKSVARKVFDVSMSIGELLQIGQENDQQRRIEEERHRNRNIIVGGWCLRMISVLPKCREMPLPLDRPILVGRSHTADVRFLNNFVSGRHLEISITPSGLEVKALSRHGATHVDLKRLAEGEVAKVSDGSEILLGGTVRIVVEKADKFLSSLSDEETRAVLWKSPS